MKHTNGHSHSRSIDWPGGLRYYDDYTIISLWLIRLNDPLEINRTGKWDKGTLRGPEFRTGNDDAMPVLKYVLISYSWSIRGTWTGTPNQRFIRNFRVVVLEYLVWWHSSRTPLPHHLSSKCNHYMSLSTISVGGWMDGWMEVISPRQGIIHSFTEPNEEI
mgnify:CR=1 FL=1